MTICTNLPKVLDFSKCDIVYLAGADLSGVEKVVGSVKSIALSESSNLPKVLDLRNCDNVYLNSADLSGVEKIKFKEGAEVTFVNASGLPKKLDVSMCGFASFSECDLTGVESIKFRDKIHAKHFMEGAKNFNGEIEYKYLKVLGDTLRRETMNIMEKLYEVEN